MADEQIKLADLMPQGGKELIAYKGKEVISKVGADIIKNIIGSIRIYKDFELHIYQPPQP